VNAAKQMSTRLIERLPMVRGSYREGADLSKINWFNVGGPAEVMFRPADVEDLSHFLAHKPSDVPVIVLGVGSNLLVRDGGIDGVVIRLGKGFVDIHCKNDTVYAGAGALSFNVAMACQNHGIAGLEFLSGIPGTIGGALAMNAGAYGNDTASVLMEAQVMDESGTLHRMKPQDIGYIYRGNTLPEGMVFIGGTFQGKAGDPKEIAARIAEITAKREGTQPIRTRTSGSTFTNPPGDKRAWELIDAAGCRGLVVGDAQVSEKHCNFLINRGKATAADIENLGEEVHRRVLEKSGVDLHWEIKRIGKFL
jgi:UDP-N-acetylmuramate dehydrogenase